MLLQEPGRTGYDWNFNFLGFPCRVHPLFLVISIVFGRSAVERSANIGLNAGVAMLVVVAVFFVSIFVHELGHALAYRKFGHRARIVLYWLGGLAISEGNSRSLNSNEKIYVSLAGPALGILFGLILCGLVYALGGSVEYVSPSFSGDYKNPFPNLSPNFSREYIQAHPAIYTFLYSSLFINLFWNLINLLPVYPLDGGQVARELFEQRDHSGNGTTNSLKLSVLTGGIVAVLGLITSDFFILMLFGYLAFSSYQTLKQSSGGGFGGGYGGGYGNQNPW